MKDLYENERKAWLQSLAGQASESFAEMAVGTMAFVGFLLLLLSIMAITN